MRTECGRFLGCVSLVSNVCTILYRWMERYLPDRGSAYKAVHVWCGVAECQRVFACVDGLSVVP